MSTDPTFATFAEHAQDVWGLVAGGHIDRHAALAALVCDALVASTADDLDPAAADEYLNMAMTWALTRARGLAGDVVLTTDPVPDDLGDLDGGA